MPSSPSSAKPLRLLSPPDAVPPPPVSTSLQVLPFGALTWENFERLCYRMMLLEGDVEHCARYGFQGEAQEGIDIFARGPDGKYHCLQAKRHQSYTPGKLRAAVQLFLDGSWAERANEFTIAVQASLGAAAMQREIEAQAAKLKTRGIAFHAIDGEQLTERLRGFTTLIDDFFGRSWFTALLGSEAASALGARLDGEAFARIRAQLARVYAAQFQFFDPGSFGSIADEDGKPSLTLLERFLKPEMQVREVVRGSDRSDFTPGKLGADATNSAAAGGLAESTGPSGSANTRVRRLPAAEWLSDGDRLVALGEAGSGKSTLLRVIALDLLHDQIHFPELSERWGQAIPIYIPFARWAAQAARNGSATGLKDIVRQSLEQFLTASLVDLLDRAIDDQRVLLLIDGLDEWNSEQAARATLVTLVTLVEAHNLPTIVSGRPRGLARIGALPASWKRGTVAPLSRGQQERIAARWFARYAVTGGEGAVSDGALRTARFMAELARDPNLATLAAGPLLLIGLVTLALRGQILPRTRTDIYDQLVRLLLEVHPGSRATASGDTQSRFRHATDPDQRRAAIARLAFEVRTGAGGAGIEVARSREILRDFLASSEGFELEDSNASAAASEIVAVNSETQGLLIERAPGEIGFVHASFEEFLGAEHIGRWPFSEIETFVRNNAGEGRWRNVITNLLSGIDRRDEFDRLVAVIEETAPDEVAQLQREALLGDVAFGAATRAPATARRLAQAAMDKVELHDWLPARREALGSVLKGLAEPALKGDIETRVAAWLPSRPNLRSRLITAFGNWAATPTLQQTLWRAFHDEDRGVQRAAAAAYARAFAGDDDARQRLLRGLRLTRSLSVAVGFIEALALGWHTDEEAQAVFAQAWVSECPELRLVGILGFASAGTATTAMRDAVVRAQGFWSEISYPHRDLAGAMLGQYWANDDELIQEALRRASGAFDSPWEIQVATNYLLECPVDRPDVCAWVLEQLGERFPFLTAHDGRTWSQVGRFALADPAIRAAANAYWCMAENRLINLHWIHFYAGQVGDHVIAEMLIEQLDVVKRTDRYWALRALLTGWGRDHTLLAPVLDDLSKCSDETLVDLAALIPEIMGDPAGARERLLGMAHLEGVRADFLAVGLAACGCDGSDDAAVEAILSKPTGTVWDPSSILFSTFAGHSRVKALAIERLRQPWAPLSAIAEGYSGDQELSQSLFTAASTLPTELRTQIVEVAASGAAGTVLETVLADALLEEDHELRARMIIAHCRQLPDDRRPAMRKLLLRKAVALGSDLSPVRATALAGLVALGALESMVTLEDRGKLVGLETSDMHKGIAAVERLVCEHFAEFEAAFGDTLDERMRSFMDRSRLSEVLSVAPSASPAARAAFLELAEADLLPATPEAMRALAVERPRSALLRDRCIAALDSKDRGNDRAMINAEIALTLRDHFPGDPVVNGRLIERLKPFPSGEAALVLSIFDPDTEALTVPEDRDDLDGNFGAWAAAVHLGARRLEAEGFCNLIAAMLTRPYRNEFDAQTIINLAIGERLQTDTVLEQLMVERLHSETIPTVSGSFARYLAAAGRLSPDARDRTMALLRQAGENCLLPVAGFDAVSEEWRAVRATLLDAVSAGLELS